MKLLEQARTKLPAKPVKQAPPPKEVKQVVKPEAKKAEAASKLPAARQPMEVAEDAVEVKRPVSKLGKKIPTSVSFNVSLRQ